MAGFTVRSRGISEGRGATSAVPNGSPLNADKRFYAALPPYNIKADGRTLTDAALSLAGVVSSPSYTFTQADVGKLAVYVYGASTTAHLYTTIASVSAGQAHLAASGVAVASGEFVFATDDTVEAQNCINDAAAVNGTAEFPEADIGLSAPLAHSAPVAIDGVGVKELYGGTDGANTANWPTVAPYLKGTVFVQFSPATDILQMSVQGRAQNLKGIGLRFAGRYVNTGHGLNSTPSANYGNIGGSWEDVKVFGVDGNHYGFLPVAIELMRWAGLRSYGGGGCRMFNGGAPSQPGNLAAFDCYFSTYIGGSAHAWHIDGSGTGGNWSACCFFGVDASVNVPSPAIAGTAAPTNAQQVIQTTTGGTMNTMVFLPGLGQSQVSGSNATYPWGLNCYREGDPGNVFVGNTAMASPSGSGASVQNQTGKLQSANTEMILQPAGAAVNSTTLSANAGAGATSITVAATTGIAAGTVLQIGDATHDGGVVECAIVASVAGTTVNLVAPANWGLDFAHTSGATVQTGAAMVLAQLSANNTFPGPNREAGFFALIGERARKASFRVLVPASYYYRLDYGNATRTWTSYIGTTG